MFERTIQNWKIKTQSINKVKYLQSIFLINYSYPKYIETLYNKKKIHISKLKSGWRCKYNFTELGIQMTIKYEYIHNYIDTIENAK